MSARDRIRAVAETLREPRSVNWISEQADAAWSTTNEELQALVGFGREDCVAKRRRKRLLWADLERERSAAGGAVHRYLEECPSVEDSGAMGQAHKQRC
mgnify:FL=1